jgi:hypothetical protein
MGASPCHWTFSCHLQLYKASSPNLHMCIQCTIDNCFLQIRQQAKDSSTERWERYWHAHPPSHNGQTCWSKCPTTEHYQEHLKNLRCVIWKLAPLIRCHNSSHQSSSLASKSEYWTHSNQGELRQGTTWDCFQARQPYARDTVVNNGKKSESALGSLDCWRYLQWGALHTMERTLDKLEKRTRYSDEQNWVYGWVIFIWKSIPWALVNKILYKKYISCSIQCIAYS